jgi:hypothetical protein
MNAICMDETKIFRTMDLLGFGQKKAKNVSFVENINIKT